MYIACFIYRVKINLLWNQINLLKIRILPFPRIKMQDQLRLIPRFLQNYKEERKARKRQTQRKQTWRRQSQRKLRKEKVKNRKTSLSISMLRIEEILVIAKPHLFFSYWLHEAHELWKDCAGWHSKMGPDCWLYHREIQNSLWPCYDKVEVLQQPKQQIYFED